MHEYFKPVCFFSSTSRIVCYRMIDWKKALNWRWIIEWKALRSLEFFISSGAGTLINNNRKGNYTVKIHQGCRCAYSRQLWKGTRLVSQYNTNSWCSKTQLSPNRLWCRTESLSLIASGLCVCNAVVIHRVPTHPWKSLTVLDLCS